MLVLLLLTTAIVGCHPTNVAVTLPDKLEHSKTIMHCLMEKDIMVEYARQVDVTIVLTEKGGTIYCSRLACGDLPACRGSECNYVGFDPTGNFLAIGSNYSLIDPGPFSFKPYHGVLVYAGTVDPFCESYFRFSSSHKPEMSSHLRCLKLMEMRGCSLMSYRVLNIERSWLAYDLTLICLGVKGDAHLITSGHHPDWVRVYHSEPYTAWTMGGELAYIRHRGLYRWISTAMITHGLMIYKGHMRGYDVNGGTVRYVPSNMFFLAKHYSLEGLLPRVVYVCMGCGDSCPVRVTRPFTDDAAQKIIMSVGQSTLLLARAFDGFFNVVKIEIEHVRRLKHEDWFGSGVLRFSDSMAHLSSFFDHYLAFMSSYHFFDIIILYLLFYHIISLVPPAIILIALFVVIMMWGTIDPG